MLELTDVIEKKDRLMVCMAGSMWTFGQVISNTAMAAYRRKSRREKGYDAENAGVAYRVVLAGNDGTRGSVRVQCVTCPDKSVHRL